MTVLFPCAAIHVNPRDVFEHVELIRKAAKLDSIEKLAFALEIDEGQFRRQLGGDGHVSLTRIVAKLGAEVPGFWARYGWRLCCRYGLPGEARRAACLALALIGHKRQARMTAQFEAVKAAVKASHRRSA
jgi:hypothetical protein